MRGLSGVCDCFGVLMTCQVQQQSSSRDSGSSADAESLRRENSQLKQELQVRLGGLFRGVSLSQIYRSS